MRQSAKIRGIGFSLSLNDFIALATAVRCFYCKSKFTNNQTVDRFNNDLGYTKENCVAACSRCNHIKGSITKNDIKLVKKILKLIKEAA